MFMIKFSMKKRFVENGSLSQMVKKYGRFPEILAKTYVRQALAGLVYLHDQGKVGKLFFFFFSNC